MWIVKSAQEPVYTVFKNATPKGMIMKTRAVYHWFDAYDLKEERL
jgi:hypothetical protein